jgi:trehalose 2-sulfotransferase
VPGAEAGVAVTRSYLVCTTPRTGSTLLCHDLRRTRLAGLPYELWLEQTEAARWAAAGATTFAEYFAGFRDRTVTPNGVVGCKVMWYQLARGLALLRDAGYGNGSTDDAAVLADAFPGVRYVWLRREDRVRQAVSLWRAKATRQYHVTSGGARAPVPPYDYGAIRDQMGRLETLDASWREWFASQRIDPVPVTYEQLVAGRERALRALLRALAITIPPGFALRRGRFVRANRSQRLADAATDAYVEQYRRDAATRV